MERPRFRSFLPAILIGALGFALTLDFRVQERAAEGLAGRRAELASIAAVRQRHTAALERDLARLRARADALAARTGDAELTAMRALVEELGLATGTVPVAGPGIVVELADAEKGNAALSDPDVQIQDVDVQSVVNELWAAGAEAIAVNGQRVVGTTAIRNAGGAILVNFKVLTSPYRVTAIGPGGLAIRFADAQISRHFRRWVQIYGLGFAVRSESHLDVPAYAGGLRAGEAHVLRPKGER